MLHTETVSAATLGLLTQLMQDNNLKDIAYLSSLLSFTDMLHAYEQKYKANTIIPLKAITYWDDINFSEPIKMLDAKVFQWKKIEKRLLQMQQRPHVIFPAL